MAVGPEAETVELSSRARARAQLEDGPAKPIPSTASSVGSPMEALERDEILRTRWFSLIIIALAAGAAVMAIFIPGSDPLARNILFVAMSIGVVSAGFMLYQTLDPVRFRQPRTAIGWLFPATVVNAAVLYFGVFSPAPMAVVLGVYFIGLGKQSWVAIVAYLVCAIAHASFAIVVISGGRDLGIVHPNLTVTQEIIIQVLVQIILLTTIVTARISRRTALIAVSELEQAVRLVAHREALLLEAREALDSALRAKRGRFSDQTLGDYRLGNILGRGAMGEVYEGTNVKSGANVAVKLLSQTSLANANVVLRFLRELRTAAGIMSPHVVRVIEVGENPLPYLVMERLEGATLSEILREKRTMAPGEVIEMIAQIGVGISAAATAGIVHRDLKPQNVFCDHGTWKVLDFGIARGIDHGDTLTAGHIVGTPSYMAPEQASGGEVDHLTDLYAVAAIAYRAFTGHPPFAAREIAETLYRVVHTRPLRPSFLAPELHADVDLALAIGMAPIPAQRFASAAELASALRDAIRGNLSNALRARGAAIVETAGWATRQGPTRLVRASR